MIFDQSNENMVQSDLRNGQINENTVQLDLKHDLKPKYPKHGSVRFSKMISVQSNENTVKLNLKIKVMR